MSILVEMKFGSHLYGTSTPASDLDLKRVHLPPARDILLQRAKGVIATKTKVDEHAKNTADDVDIESFTLQRFLGLAAECQTVAVDMVFAPAWSWTDAPSPIWLEVLANRHRLLTRRHASFVGYCRTQANKYGIRGSRVAAARKAMELLAAHASGAGQTKLAEISSDIERMTALTEHMEVLDLPSPGDTVVRHWNVCDRKMPYTASIKNAQGIMERVVSEYGHRALAAETNQGIDWKAVSHAVRIGRQAIELFDTGTVIFPRPDAAYLLEIKTGSRPYREVADEIDRLLPEVEAAAHRSLLPDAPDLEWIDDFVAMTYRRWIG
jgi:hypothetical protein